MAYPIEDIALIGGFWNCEDRARNLLTEMRPWFNKIIITVQESPDNTLQVVREIADVTIEDRWWGHGNPSFQKANAHNPYEWSFLISDDEMPDNTLLASLGGLIQDTWFDGFWFHFRSWIEDIEFTGEQDNHLRLWRSKVPWPSTIHSRPMIDNTYHSTTGHIEHRRSLDEMMSDYLRRYQIGKGNKQWDVHNIRMMEQACSKIAAIKGWDFVQTKSWWPEVAKLAF